MKCGIRMLKPGETVKRVPNKKNKRKKPPTLAELVGPIDTPHYEELEEFQTECRLYGAAAYLEW